MSGSAALVCPRRSIAAGAIVCILVAAASVVPAFAQNNTSHWGASVSFTPQWKAHDKLQELLWAEGDPALEGSEFTVGIVRGSTRGGDWGVSFVRKPVKDGATITRIDEQSDAQFSGRQTHTLVFQDVYLQGVEFHGFIPFATIKDRVQIGVNLAGGIAKTRGTIEETFETFSQFRLPNGEVITNQDTSTNTFPAKEIIYEYQPLGKVEAQAAFILAPSFKLKVGGGFNMPSDVCFRVGATVLIGAR
jgi:hypothetical protein